MVLRKPACKVYRAGRETGEAAERSAAAVLPNPKEMDAGFLAAKTTGISLRKPGTPDLTQRNG